MGPWEVTEVCYGLGSGRVSFLLKKGVLGWALACSPAVAARASFLELLQPPCHHEGGPRAMERNAGTHPGPDSLRL